MLAAVFDNRINMSASMNVSDGASAIVGVSASVYGIVSVSLGLSLCFSLGHS